MGKVTQISRDRNQSLLWDTCRALETLLVIAIRGRCAHTNLTFIVRAEAGKCGGNDDPFFDIEIKWEQLYLLQEVSVSEYLKIKLYRWRC